MAKSTVNLVEVVAAQQPVVVRKDVPQIVVPESVSYKDAAEFCAQKHREAEEIIVFAHSNKCLTWVGAYALAMVLSENYSAVPAADRSSVVTVPTSSGPRKLIWGAWNVAGLGLVEQSGGMGPHGVTYKLKVQSARKNTAQVEQLFKLLDERVKMRELYAGCALQLQCDDEGDLRLDMPPEAISLADVKPQEVILSAQNAAAVKAELYLPIDKPELLESVGVSARRGILLAGRPGTGKTMTAKAAAKMAVDRGWTVFYLPDARGMESALAIASQSAPAMLICEDLDRQLGRSRDAMTDRILNALDGLDRSARVIFIATTNDASQLPAALLRPGRLDSYMVFTPPDADAAEKLLRKYLGDRCPADLNGAPKSCAGLLPASVREVASRAILHGLADGRSGVLDPEDIQVAAQAVRLQQAELEKAETRKAKVKAVRVFSGPKGEDEAVVTGGVLMDGSEVLDNDDD
jgi:hypothetical protein